MADAQKPRERALQEAVSRAVRDNLIPLQRTLDDLQQAYADLVSACSSTRPTNALPAMLRAQATSASLTASLSVLSSFITNIMQQRDRDFPEQENVSESMDDARATAVEVTEPPAVPEAAARKAPERRTEQAPHVEKPRVEATIGLTEPAAESAAESVYAGETVLEEPEVTSAPEIASEPVVEEQVAEELASEEPVVVFDVASLPASEQELHKRANRVAKVSMQDIKMLKPEEVRKGREKKDICIRLRGELDKARKEYDRRFQKILDHPVDYFHHWLVEILGDGDPETLGEYPYPSPVMRR